jgi:hypothetical protein
VHEAWFADVQMDQDLFDQLGVRAQSAEAVEREVLNHVRAAGVRAFGARSGCSARCPAPAGDAAALA